MTDSVSRDICNLIDGEAAGWLKTVENWHCVADSVSHETAPLTLKMQLGCQTKSTTSSEPGAFGDCPDRPTARERADRFARASEAGELSDQRKRLIEMIRANPLGVDMEPLGEHTASWVENCGPCGGRGQVNCRGCRGSGKQSCGSCYGKGEQECSFCRGQGKSEHRDPYTGEIKSSACLSCGGRGSRRCNSCSGRGNRICRGCGGSGREICATCTGLGRISHSITVTAYSSVKRIFTLLSEDLSGWVKDYVLGGDKTRAGQLAPLAKAARWDLSELSFSEQAGYPIKAEMPGELDAVTALIRPDERFASEPVETHFVGGKLHAVELGGVLDSTVEQLLADDPGPGVTDSKRTRRWLNTGIGEKLLEMNSPDEYSGQVIGKLQLFTQTAVNQLDARIRGLKEHMARERSTLGIGRMLRGTVIGMLVFYLLFVALDAYVPGHVPWNKLGFDAAVRFMPFLYQALGDGNSVIGGLTIMTLGVAIVVIGLWTWLFAQPRRRKFRHFALRVVLMTLLVPPFLVGNQLVLQYHDAFGLLPQSQESAKYYASAWGVPEMAEYDPEAEAKAAAIGVLWALPDIFVMASLLALLRERRRKDKQSKSQVELLENPILLKQLGY